MLQFTAHQTACRCQIPQSQSRTQRQLDHTAQACGLLGAGDSAASSTSAPNHCSFQARDWIESTRISANTSTEAVVVADDNAHEAG